MPSPTMADIARRAGVSKNTVSLALRNDSRLPLATRERLQTIAAEMGYQRNPLVAHLMAQLRKGRSPRHQPTLALVNANRDPDAFSHHPTIPVYVEGCRQRAIELGYQLDSFWLHEPGLDGLRLNRILRARNIGGLVLIGLMEENRLPAAFLPTWDAFPAVVTGVRTRDPALSFACTDHHMLTVRAVERAWQLGYRRPALVVDESIEHLVEGRFSAGFFTALTRLGARKILPPFQQFHAAREKVSLFHHWLLKTQPDVILTLYASVERWLKEMPLRIPEEIGLIQLERRRQQPWVSGMDQHNDVVGASALDMVIGMIHRNEIGTPAFPKATLIGSTWCEGETTRGACAD